jgi:beta-lactamase class A
MSAEMWDLLGQRLRERAEAFDGLAGFVVKDLTSGASVVFREDEQFPSASTIKIHILAALLRAAEDGALSLDERIALTPDLRVAGSGVITYLEHPVELSLFDIAVLMILVSDNSATNICIQRVGMAKVNALIGEFGLKQTALRRLMQDQEAIRSGRENVSTPAELAKTLEALHANKPSARTAQQVLSVLAKSKPSPFRLAIPPAIKIAHKTGRMPRVRAEAGIVYLPDRPYVIAVMTRYAMVDDAEQDAFVSDIARVAHQFMSALATSNTYGQGLPG